MASSDWFASLHSTPTSAADALTFFAEALRYTYRETLGRWRLADLLVGLAYLSRRGGGGGEGCEAADHPAAAVAAAGGAPAGSAGPEATCPAAAADLMARLAAVRRAMCYCRALRQRSPAAQAAVFVSLGLDPTCDILAHAPTAGLVRPAYALLKDASLQRIVLVVRGTHSVRDVFTNLASAERPHHLLVSKADGSGGQELLTGYAHHGMLCAARWLVREVGPALAQALAANPGFEPLITGHSLGGGTAALAAMMLREAAGTTPAFAQASAIGIACPAVVTAELAAGCAPFTTTVVCGADLVPFISPAAVDALRSEVLASSWGTALAADVRAHAAVRAVEAWVGAAGAAVACLVPYACAGAARPWRASANVALKPAAAKEKEEEAQAAGDGVPADSTPSSAFSSFACFRPRRPGASRTQAASGGGWIPVNAFAGGGVGVGGGAAVESAGDGGPSSEEEEEAVSAQGVGADMDALAAALAAEEESEGRLPSSSSISTPMVVPTRRRDVAHPPIRRQTYPAGRVMHLVPTAVFRHVRATAIAATPRGPSGVAATAAAAASSSSHLPPRPAITARMARPGDYVLLDRVPHSAYSTIRLAGGLVTALREHFIPSYLGAFDAAMPAVAERVAKVVATARAGGADV
jgi:hypothetical protein